MCLRSKIGFGPLCLAYVLIITELEDASLWLRSWIFNNGFYLLLNAS